MAVGYVANGMGALTNPLIYGPVICAAVSAGLLTSVPFWYLSGKDYKKIMI